MKSVQVRYTEEFKVLLGNSRSQAAVMVLGVGESTGGEDNLHPDSDQWLYVSSGQGKAVIKGEAIELRDGLLVLIEKGETHEIINTGERPLETLNFYIPPAYS